MGFSEVVAAQTRGEKVRCAELVMLDFTTGKQRFWTGWGKLQTNDGNEWIGAWELGSIGQVRQSIGGKAVEQTFTLSGADSRFVTLAKGDRGVWYNRTVQIFYQFFDEASQVLDQPFAMWFGRMRSLSPKKDPTEDGTVYAIELSAETIMSGKKRPRAGYMTPTDQKVRFAGDAGCDRVPGIQAKNIKFPDY